MVNVTPKKKVLNAEKLATSEPKQDRNWWIDIVMGLALVVMLIYGAYHIWFAR